VDPSNAGVLTVKLTPCEALPYADMKRTPPSSTIATARPGMLYDLTVFLRKSFKMLVSFGKYEFAFANNEGIEKLKMDILVFHLLMINFCMFKYFMSLIYIRFND
jgi:hypothetical protein